MTKASKRKIFQGHLGFFALGSLLLSSCGNSSSSSSASSILPPSSSSSSSSSSSLSSTPLDPSSIPASSGSIVSSSIASSSVISSSSAPSSYIKEKIDAIRTGHNYTLDITSYLEGTPDDAFTDTYVITDGQIYTATVAGEYTFYINSKVQIYVGMPE